MDLNKEIEAPTEAPVAKAPRKSKKTAAVVEETPRGKLVTRFGVQMWIKE